MMIDSKLKLIALTSFLTCAFAGYSGNKDRAGQAGATELNINPWARSSGLAGANSGSIRGLESIYSNIAGLAFTKKTELLLSRCNWLNGSGININSFGFSQHIGSSGVIGLGIMSMNFGDIPITTVDLPEGEIGTFSPQYINLNLAYSKGFSDNIFGGINVKTISEQISDVKANGFALDAGIQYVTGKYDNLKFGIALRNIGPKMAYKGDGLSVRVPLLNNPTGGQTIAVQQKSASFELPSQLNIGATYDFYLSPDSVAVKPHRLSISGNFTANSFSKDEFRVGVEYAWKSMFMLRAGYNYEAGVINSDERTTAHIGPCGGITVEAPFKRSGTSTFALDYSYRASNPFQGTHTVGIRINL